MPGTGTCISNKGKSCWGWSACSGHSQNLTQLLSTAVLERNALRISGYANTQNDLQNALERVAQEAQTLNLSGEVVLLIEENLQLRTQESRAIDLMRRGSWGSSQGDAVW
jgi:hypothetical protein